MIVIAIIGVLAAIAVPNFQRARAHANEKACYANQKVIVGALVQYNLDKNESYDTNPIDWSILLEGGYLKHLPSDPGAGSGDTSANYQLSSSVKDTIECVVHGQPKHVAESAGSPSS